MSLQTIEDSTEIPSARKKEDIVIYPTSENQSLENQVCI